MSSHTLIGLLFALAAPTVMVALGTVYALWFDPKDTRPRGTLARLK